jgi:hypothetical protein
LQTIACAFLQGALQLKNMSDYPAGTVFAPQKAITGTYGVSRNPRKELALECFLESSCSSFEYTIKLLMIDFMNKI